MIAGLARGGIIIIIVGVGNTALQLCFQVFPRSHDMKMVNDMMDGQLLLILFYWNILGRVFLYSEGLKIVRTQTCPMPQPNTDANKFLSEFDTTHKAPLEQHRKKALWLFRGRNS